MVSSIPEAALREIARPVTPCGAFAADPCVNVSEACAGSATDVVESAALCSDIEAWPGTPPLDAEAGDLVTAAAAAPAPSMAEAAAEDPLAELEAARVAFARSQYAEAIELLAGWTAAHGAAAGASDRQAEAAALMARAYASLGDLPAPRSSGRARWCRS